jgi:hypothetical protein
MRAIKALRSVDIEDKNHTLVDGWLDTVSARLTVYSGVANPTASQVPNGQWIIYKNTTLNETRLWTNDNGTMKKSVALT